MNSCVLYLCVLGVLVKKIEKERRNQLIRTKQRMVLSVNEIKQMSKALGYDLSECKSRTRNGIVKWVCETHQVEKETVEKKLPLDIVLLDGCGETSFRT